MTDKQQGALAATLCITAGSLFIAALFGAWMHDPYFVIVFIILAIVSAGCGCHTWSTKP